MMKKQCWILITKSNKNLCQLLRKKTARSITFKSTTKENKAMHQRPEQGSVTNSKVHVSHLHNFQQSKNQSDPRARAKMKNIAKWINKAEN
mmetsp:Transcript_55634/g.134861  ORF Transcript_55634/g.134861 Transcript_55634/m.134861 type:complete len:91 (+) Transcript_55634:1047-1319(+)